MKNGDISNQAAVTIGFRCEDNLIKYREAGLKNKVLNAIVGREKRAEIDTAFSSVMEYYFRHTDFSVDLVVLKENYTPELKNILEDLPFNRIVVILKETQITSRLLSGDLTFYVDDDAERRSLIGNKYAIPMSLLKSHVG